jgi:hypothetical protein
MSRRDYKDIDLASPRLPIYQEQRVLGMVVQVPGNNTSLQVGTYDHTILRTNTNTYSKLLK